MSISQKVYLEPKWLRYLFSHLSSHEASRIREQQKQEVAHFVRRIYFVRDLKVQASFLSEGLTISSEELCTVQRLKGLSLDFVGRADDFVGRADDFVGRADNFVGRADNFVGRADNFVGRADDWAKKSEVT